MAATPQSINYWLLVEQFRQKQEQSFQFTFGFLISNLKILVSQACITIPFIDSSLFSSFFSGFRSPT
jgi:hypothetical protein